MKEAHQTFVVPAKNEERHLIKKKASILILSGPQQGEEVIIESTPFTIGSSDGCDLLLKDTAVSRKHCIIKSDGHTFSIEDTNSTNGSFLCGLRIMHAYLTPGSELRLGNTRLLFSPSLEFTDIPLSQNNHFGDAIGASDAMRRIFYLAESYSPTDATIMLTGETGTGKEILAEEIHKHSKRANKPFVVIDCTSISRDIVESELFGHVKGAFTGATSDRSGAFESADGGTVFLDEIGELPQELQPKLLRVLEKREIKRVGSNDIRKIDVRIICATNRNIKKEISEGNFREDLYYRLSVVNIELPPLREHKEDIPLLAETFMNRLHNTNARDEIQDFDNAMNALMRYDWPGNIREFRNLIDRAYYHIQKPVDILQCQQGGTLLKQSNNGSNNEEENSVTNNVDTTKPFKDEKNRLIDDFEHQYIKELLARNNGNVSKSAREADIERAYLQRLIKKYGLNSQRMIIKRLLAKLIPHTKSAHDTKATLDKDELGIKGEKLAAEHLIAKGFKIIGERVHVGIDELDLIAIDFRNPMVEQLVFVEVKTRSSDLFGGGKAAVDKRKRNALARAAKGYMKANLTKPHAIRFDIIEVTKSSQSSDSFEITHHENAISLPPELITSALHNNKGH